MPWLYLRSKGSGMARTKEPVPRLGFSVPETAASLGLSENRVWSLVNNGRLNHVRVGRRVIIPAAAIEQFLRDAGTRPVPVRA